MGKTYERARLDKLSALKLLDTKAEREFDDIVKLAQHICGTPVALVSLVDEKRQWFKACLGLGVGETPRDVAFCDHTIRLRETFVVRDATQDFRFMANPLVTGEPHIRFYAGAPLWTEDGYCIGSLCVIDTKPSHLTEDQIAALEALARQVMVVVEKRTISSESQLDQLQAKQANSRLQDVTSMAEAGVFNIDKTGLCTFANEAWGRIMGIPSDQLLGYSYMSMIVEEDRMAYFDKLMKAREQKIPFKETARVRRMDGSIRHVECQSMPDREGGRIGTAYDVTDYVERIRSLEKELLDFQVPMLKKAE